jgi:hypothetical protein
MQKIITKKCRPDRYQAPLANDRLMISKSRRNPENPGGTAEAVAPVVMGDTPVQGRKPWDLGFVKWDQIPVDFFEPIHRLKPGEVSDVLWYPAIRFSDRQAR